MQCPQCGSAVEDAAESCFNCGHALRAPQITLKRGSVVAGRYEILAPLGKGGMGVVYKARDHKLEETVAIKVLRPEVAADPEMERRFLSEIRLARRVRHRNVCGIHEYGEDGSLRYIAMEFIEGVDLRRMLTESGGLPLDQAFDICIHTAAGLQAIHEAGIIHRDLKTANLMIDARGIVRLMDFGIAKQHGGEATRGGATATGLVVGSPEYMSPEQARGEKVDFRSDIYALGVVAFEIFTGHVPFRGETPIATIFKHLQDPPPLEGPEAPALPPAVIPALRKALAKSADDRFATAAEFAQAMTDARDASGIAPLAAGPMTPRPQATISLAAQSTPTPRPMPTVSPSMSPTQARFENAPTRVRAAPLAPRGPARGRNAALAAAVVLTVVGAWLWNRRGEETAPAPPVASPGSPPAPSPVPPVAEGAGTLILDALPWGEVLEVTDAKGVSQALPPNRFTPLALALAPGDYTVRVKPPSGERPRSITVTVRASGAETRVVEFARVDAAAYLRKSGL